MKLKSILLVTIFLLSVSCQRKKGCIDRLASNYDSHAKKESVCFYEGRFVLWTDQANLDKYKGETLLYYLNEELAATDSLMKAATENPECDAAEGLTFRHDLGANTTGSLHYKVTRKINNQVIADSSLTLEGGYCVAQKMVFR